MIILGMSYYLKKCYYLILGSHEMTIIAVVPIAIDEEDKKNIFNTLNRHLASIFDVSITIVPEPP
jgi:hypothetical protein